MMALYNTSVTRFEPSFYLRKRNFTKRNSENYRLEMEILFITGPKKLNNYMQVSVGVLS